jgi:RNA polymerase sigma-70 factor (ECF subfamily)
MRKSKTYKELALKFKNTRTEKSYNELYKKMKPGLWNYVNRMVKDKDVTDDIVSTTLTKVYLKIDQYDENYQITTWAYRIAYNECIGWFRYKKDKLSLSIFTDSGYDPTTSGTFSIDEEDALKTENDFLDEERAIQSKISLIHSAIDNLPRMYNRYMSERFINKKSYKDILNIMLDEEEGISLQTVKNRIFRGRQLIQKSLKKLPEFADITR